MITAADSVLKVGPIEYQIEVVEDLRDQGRDLSGYILHDKCVVKLEQSLAPQMQRCTLWHEALHAILAQAGFMKHDERMIEALAFGTLDVLEENPWMIPDGLVDSTE